MFADHEIETSVRQRNSLRIPLNQRKGRTVLALDPPRRGQLLAGEVHADRTGPSAGEPCREVGRAARQLQDVETVDISQDAEITFRNREKPPHDIRPRPHLLGRSIGEAFVHDRPERPVQCYLGGPSTGHLVQATASAVSGVSPAMNLDAGATAAGLRSRYVAAVQGQVQAVQCGRGRFPAIPPA